MPDPPEEGTQYFMATIRAEYIGDGSDTLYGWDLEAAGDATKVDPRGRLWWLLVNDSG